MPRRDHVTMLDLADLERVVANLAATLAAIDRRRVVAAENDQLPGASSNIDNRSGKGGHSDPTAAAATRSVSGRRRTQTLRALVNATVRLTETLTARLVAADRSSAATATEQYTAQLEGRAQVGACSTCGRYCDGGGDNDILRPGPRGSRLCPACSGVIGRRSRSRHGRSDWRALDEPDQAALLELVANERTGPAT